MATVDVDGGAQDEPVEIAGPESVVESLEGVLARNLQVRVADRGWRHADLSAEMQARGFGWTANTATQVMGVLRRVTLLELAALCGIFECPLVDLLRGDFIIELPAGERYVSLNDVRNSLREGGGGFLAGSGPVHFTTDTEKAAMKRLGVSLADLQAAAQHLYGQPSIDAARDRRVLRDDPDLDPRTLQAKRGHAMRGVLAELANHFAELSADVGGGDHSSREDPAAARVRSGTSGP